MAFFLFLIFCLIVILILFSTIKIEIINLKYKSQYKNHINDNFMIIIKYCVMNIIPIVRLKITKEKINKIKLNDKITKKIKNIDLELFLNNIKNNKKLFKEIKNMKLLNIKNIYLKLELGTKNAALTSIIVPTIETITLLLIRKKIKKYENQIFIINPLYINQNIINIKLSGIFKIKMIHIINMIYVLIKKGKVNKYDRTSNRGTYGYSYE